MQIIPSRRNEAQCMGERAMRVPRRTESRSYRCIAIPYFRTISASRISRLWNIGFSEVTFSWPGVSVRYHQVSRRRSESDAASDRASHCTALLDALDWM